jgi:Domain of unknown function (DUF6766)
MRRALRNHSLTIFFGTIFLAALLGQAIAGHAAYNQDQVDHGRAAVSLSEYVASSPFWASVMENWQSEYLQFTLLMVATVWLLQRGSPESKELDKSGRESKRDQRMEYAADRGSPVWARVGGIRTALYSNSLLILMTAIFIGSWFAQSVTGLTEFNQQQREHHEAAISWLSYVSGPSFWENTLENWQSEFLAVGSFAAFTIFLRQRGSPESKPVGAPHSATGIES